MQVTESRIKDISTELKKYGVEATDAIIEAVVTIMEQRDCQYPEAVKVYTGKDVPPNTKGTSRQTKKGGGRTKQSAQQGAAVVKDFAENMSDDASDKLADMIMAKTLQKTAQKLASGQFGKLSAQVMDDMKLGWLEPLEAELVALEGTEVDEVDPKYLLSHAAVEYGEVGNGREEEAKLTPILSSPVLPSGSSSL